MKGNVDMVLKELKKLRLRNFIALTFAGLINAFGITAFLVPVKLFDSGISGTAMLISQLTSGRISLSVALLVLNIPLFLYGLKKQGVQFTVYGIYSVGMYSLGAWLITDVLPIDVVSSSPLAENDLLLCALFGGVLSGIGSGLAIKFSGVMDGIEALAVIFAKHIGISVGTFVMAYNVVLYIIAGACLASWVLPLYSIVAYFAALKALDYIVEGISRSKAALIVTVESEKICKALSETFGCGVTCIEARGGYSQSKRTVLYFVVNRFQIGKMKRIVHEIDAMAYITINDVADIFSANIDKD